MKRRNFVLVSIAGAAAVAVPSYYFWNKNDLKDDPAQYPVVLASFLEYDTLARLGESYLKRFPDERGRDTLLNALFNHKSIERDHLENYLKKQIKQDYCQERIVQLDGWIFSLTEARQCALLYLSIPKSLPHAR